MTKKDIIRELQYLGIDFDPKSTKQELFDVLNSQSLTSTSNDADSLHKVEEVQPLAAEMALEEFAGVEIKDYMPMSAFDFCKQANIRGFNKNFLVKKYSMHQFPIEEWKAIMTKEKLS